MAQTKAQLLGPVVGDVTIDASTLSLDAENNKVGIGTTEADLRLHVNGPNALPSSSGSTSTGHLTLRDKAGSATHGMFMGVSDAAPWGSWIQAQDANNLATNYPLLLNPNGGNIGIGTDNPDEKLEVYDGNIQQYNLNASGGTGLILQNYADGGGGNTTPYSFIRAKSNPIRNAGEIRFGRDSAYGSAAEADSHMSFWTALNDTNIERLRITSDGKVGIGAPAPAKTLEVKGDVRIYNATDTNSAILDITADSTGSNGVNLTSTYFGSGGFGPIRFTTSDTERLRIDSSGRLLLGTSTAVKNADRLSGNKIALVGTGLNYPSTIITSYATASADAGPIIEMQKSRGETDGSMTIVADNDRLGNLQFLGSDGTNFVRGAAIAGYVDGTPGTNDMPGRLSFQTTSDGASSPTERLRITSAGLVGIGTDNPSELLHLQSGHTKQILKSTNLNTASILIFDTHNINTADFLLGQLTGRWNGNDVAYINFEAGADTTNKDDGIITFLTSASGSSPTEKLRITSSGNVGIGTNNPTDHLEILNNNASGLTFKTTENHYAQITSDCNRTGADSHLLAIEGYWNGTPVAEIALIAGSDTTNKDDGQIIFRTSSANNLNSNERLRITSEGTVNINTSADGGIGGFAQPQLYLKTNSTAWHSGMHFEESGGDSLGVINHSSDGFEIAQSYRTAAGSYKPIIFRTSGTERLRITSGGELVINGNPQAKARLDVGQAGNSLPAFNITFPDNSFYRNLGTVGPNDTPGNNASNGGQYLHIRLKTIWNDNSMTMFRITGYYSYSAYTESYVGMYRYNYSGNRYAPYGQVISNQSRATVHSMYNTNADPGYLVIVCDWNTNYMGLMIEHYGAGGSYGSNMQHDLQIIDTKRSTGTSAQW